MKLFKAALLSAAMVATGAVAAYAADPVPAQPPQVAYSASRLLGPKVGPNIGIPATRSVAPSAGAPSATGSVWGPNGPSESGGSYYEKPGFGPKTN